FLIYGEIMKKFLIPLILSLLFVSCSNQNQTSTVNFTIPAWWIWCVVDLACSALYWYTGLHFTAGLYLIYAIVAVFGYMKWNSMINNEHVEG
ncbi:MAG: nicotinamide mononucleotide transporter, partial [Bacteroidaceae bacterium]|nr:nicotinamide mononucleotide transporter [Bacteroidaceae bacterium]